MDAAHTIFFENELQHIMAMALETEYPQLLAKSLFPVTNEAGPGAEQVAYYLYDRVGLAKIINSAADDWPSVDVFGQKFYAVIRSVGASYNYTFQEIRAARMAGRSLEQMRANACREAVEYKTDDLGWNGELKYGIVGFLRHPNVTSYVTRNGAGGYGRWVPYSTLTTKTPDEIILDVNILLNTPDSLMKRQGVINTVMISPDEYAHIASTPRSANSDTTILEFLRRVHPGVTFMAAQPLADVSPAVVGGGNTSNLMVGFRKDPTYLQFHVPQLYEQFPPETNGVRWKIRGHERTAGVLIYRPTSVVIAEGI
jgi:hypothetical protein